MSGEHRTTEMAWRPPQPIQELVNAGCHDLVPELIRSFVSDASSRLHTVRSAVAQGDLALLQRQMHAMRGSALQMGAGRMATLCREIESSADGRRVAELCAAFDQTQRAMADYLLNCECVGERMESGRCPSKLEPNLKAISPTPSAF